MRDSTERSRGRTSWGTRRIVTLGIALSVASLAILYVLTANTAFQIPGLARLAMPCSVIVGLICGLTALLAGVYRCRITLLVVAIPLLAIGAVALLECLVGVDLGLDSWLTTRLAERDGVRLPRAGPIPALGFLLLGTAFGMQALFPLTATVWFRCALLTTAATAALFSAAIWVTQWDSVTGWLRFRDSGLSSLLGLLAISSAALWRTRRELGGASKASGALRASLPVLVGCVTLTLVVWHGWNHAVDRGGKQLFGAKCDEIRSSILHQLNSCEQVLRGTQALFRSSDLVRPDEWHNYCQTLGFQDHRPEIKLLGYLTRLADEPVDAYADRVRSAAGRLGKRAEEKAIFSGFRYWSGTTNESEAEAEEHTAVLFVEPLSSEGGHLLGFDALSARTTREALVACRETGLATVSGALSTGSGDAPLAAFGDVVMFLPAVGRSWPGPAHDPTDSSKRHRPLAGFVFAILDIETTMAALRTRSFADVKLEIFDNSETYPETPLYSSHPEVTDVSDTEPIPAPGLEPFDRKKREVATHGRSWTLHLTPTPKFERSLSRSIPVSVLLVGTLISLLLFSLNWSFATTRRRALSLARRMSAARAQLDQRMRALVESASEGIVTSGSNGVIVAANSAAESTFDYEAGELVGERLRRVLPRVADVFADSSSANIARSAEPSLPSGAFETLGVQKSGKTIPLHVSIAAYTFRDDVSHTAFVRDITEQKAAERALKSYARELERSNEELDSFAYVASHDLRSPLRGIANLAKWIEEDSADAFSEASREHLTKLRARVKRMEGLLEDLLQYSRAGRGSSQIEAFSLAELIREVCEILQIPATFDVRVENGSRLITTYRAPLSQVFLNLLSNAVKHHDRDDGVIEISCREVSSAFEFVVRDDGPGIPREYRERVFELFQTLQPRDRVEGSGMGLAIVKKLVARFDGVIHVTSAPGGGAEFHFTWPKIPEGLPCEGVTQTS